MKKPCLPAVLFALVMFGCGSGAVEEQGSAPDKTPAPAEQPAEKPAVVEHDYSAGLPEWFARSKTPDRIELRFDESKPADADTGPEAYGTETKNKLILYKKQEGEVRSFYIMNYTIAKMTPPEEEEGVEDKKGDPEWEESGRAEHLLCRVDGTWTLEGDTLLLTQHSRWQTVNVLGRSGNPMGPADRQDFEGDIQARYRVTETDNGVSLKKQGAAGEGFEATYSLAF